MNLMHLLNYYLQLPKNLHTNQVMTRCMDILPKDLFSSVLNTKQTVYCFVQFGSMSFGIFGHPFSNGGGFLGCVQAQLMGFSLGGPTLGFRIFNKMVWKVVFLTAFLTLHFES